MKILVTPLDWGLGHATRCIPVIDTLQRLGHNVVIAGSGPSLDLLKIEFPANRFYEIASYDINYSNRVPLLLHLLLKIPSILAVVRKEHQQVADIVEREKIDVVISDNRYGCYHKSIPSAIITHQLSIQSPLSAIINHFNHKSISRFNQCWVPDTPDHSLSGRLSISNIPCKFIGPLSRMKNHESRIANTEYRIQNPEYRIQNPEYRVQNPEYRITDHSFTEPFKILGLISGPEPHRTSFDRLLTSQLTGYSFKLVRGQPSHEKGNHPIFNHLPSKELNELIEAAEVVICRPGYSSIMDLAALNKKAIFVPTPGQTEQLYLAKELERKKIAPMVSQKKFSLPVALDRLKVYPGFTGSYFKGNLLEKTLREFLD